MPAILPFIPLIASGVGAAGAYFGGRAANKAKSTTTPTVSPEYSPLQAQILKMVQQRLASSPDLSGYQANGMQEINSAYRNAAVGQSNDLTSRGLSTSPVAATVMATRDNARAGSLAQFLNTLPMLRRQMQDQDLSNATGVLNFGRGSTTTGESGGGAAGGFTNLAQYLGYLSGKGAFGGGGTGTDGPGTGGISGMGGGGFNWGSLFPKPAMYKVPALSSVPSDTMGWG